MFCSLALVCSEDHRTKFMKRTSMIKNPRTYVCLVVCVFSLLVFVKSDVHAASALLTYRVVDLGALEQAVGGMVRGPSAANEVVGAAVAPGSGIRAFLLTMSGVENLEGLPGTDWSSSHGINDIGGVVGSSNTAAAVRAFRWTRAGGVQALGALPGDSGSEAFGINTHNEVAGYSSGPNGVEATIWRSNGQIQGLGRLLNGDHSRGLAINERSEVVGASGTAGGTRAFIWSSNAGMRDLGTLPGDDNSTAYAINSRGEVVGFSDGPSGARAVLWTLSQAIESIGTLPGGNSSRALSINDRSDVVGTSESFLGPRAFLWTRAAGMRDLNDLIPNDSDFVLFEAAGINNLGAIVALGRDRDSHGDAHAYHEFPTRVFLLIPLP
jgi:probable HAF family extracellular repeat protein